MAVDMPVKEELSQESDDFEIVYEENETPDEKPLEEPKEDEEKTGDIEESEEEKPEEVAGAEEDLGVPPPDDEDAEYEDAEYKSYSAGVKKRIKREIRLRKEVEERLEVTEGQRDQAVNYIKQGANAYKQLQDQHDQLQDQYYKLLDASMSSTIEQKIGELQRAKEQGDTSAELKAQSEIEELRFNKRELTSIINAYNTQKQQRQTQQPQQQTPQQSGPPALAVEWVKKNKWVKEAKYSAQREYIKVLDNQLIQAGYDPNTELYYKEMDRKLRIAFPSLRALDKKKTPAPAPNKSVVAPTTSSTEGASRNVSSKRIVLTKADMETMRKFGMDPSNKQHVLSFAKQRVGA